MKQIYLVPKPLWVCMMAAFCGSQMSVALAQEPGAQDTMVQESVVQEPGVSQAPVQDQAVNPLQGSVIKGLEKSARLSSETHTLEAMMEEANVSFGAMLPTLDLRGATGRERNKIRGGETRTYNANSYGIEARQNIFNGFASQARYLSAYASAMQKYYQVMDLGNEIALETSTSHINVSRFQSLTKLAEDNLNYHKELMQRIQEKVTSGVARQSDLEQAKSRYTLALSNLATEKANTFSAMATYQRIVDEVWPINQMGEYIVKANFEVDNRERLVYALNNHPLIKAANANIRAANQSVTAASEGFFPRVDLRAKSDVYSNYLSTFDERQISSVDLLASMNLFRGGADKASRNAAIKRKMRSLDDKLGVCRVVRQSAQTALYDVTSSERKLNYFREQADAIGKARAAYEQQFSIGRRSLLDLLSAENEHYQAQRALINVEADLSVSKLKLLATTGQLVELFAVENSIVADEPTRRQVLFYKDQSGDTENEPCPDSLINLDDFQLPNIGFDDSLKGVSNTLEETMPTKPIEVAQAGNGQRAALTDPTFVSQELIKKTNEWAKAWESKDVNRYIGFYAPVFSPEQGTYESWQANRRQRLAAAKEIDIEVSDFQVIPSFDDPEVYEIAFVQTYKAAHYQEKSRKVLTWKSIKGNWQIIREQNLPNTAEYSPEKKRLALNTSVN